MAKRRSIILTGKTIVDGGFLGIDSFNVDSISILINHPNKKSKDFEFKVAFSLNDDLEFEAIEGQLQHTLYEFTSGYDEDDNPRLSFKRLPLLFMLNGGRQEDEEVE